MNAKQAIRLYRRSGADFGGPEWELGKEIIFREKLRQFAMERIENQKIGVLVRHSVPEGGHVEISRIIEWKGVLSLIQTILRMKDCFEGVSYSQIVRPSELTA